MSIVIGRAVALICVFILAIGLLAAYDLQLAETNEYMGYRSFPLDLSYIICSGAGVFVIGMLMPTTIKMPSDFFTFLYGLFVLLPYASLFPIRNSVEFLDFLFFFVVLAAPFFAIRLSSFAVPALKVPALITSETVIISLVILCIAGVCFALSTPPASAGFDLATAYDRRIQGRDIFPAGTPLAYLNAAIVNGFAPYLAFVAGWQRRGWLLAFSLLSSLAFFYLLGLKAPLLFIAVAYVIGYSERVAKLSRMSRNIYILLLVAFILFIVEYYLSGYSYIGDYFIRRALSVPAWLSSAYLDFMASSENPTWSPLQGVNSSQPITFLVGEVFLGFPGLNANTNAFIYQLAAGGIPMYALTILLVASVFALLDANYKCTRNPALVYLGFSYSILLTEQAATTALVSSGIGALIMLVTFSGVSKRNNMFFRVYRRIVEFR